MKSTSLEVKTANLVTAGEARFGRTMFAAIAALCLIIPTTGMPASAQQAVASSVRQQATTTLPACGETLTQLSATGAQSVNIVSGTQLGLTDPPGQTDPMSTPNGRYMLFADDEVLAFQPVASLVTAAVLTTDNGSTNPGFANYAISPWDPSDWGPPALFPVAGRFIKPMSDDAAFAARSGDPFSTNGTANVTFFGGSGEFFRTFSATLPGTLLPRVLEFTDFISVAAGDLDDVEGPDGYLHDEIVAAKVGSEDGANYNYDVDVLNYASGHIADPVITPSHFSTTKPGFPDPTNLRGVLRSDNIIATVTGDFRGTGRKETAVLALGNGTLVLHTYGYETTGDTHALTELGAGETIDLVSGVATESTWKGKPIMGTLAATAGDFDGDGADEIAVAYAKWDKTGQYGIGMLIFKYDSEFKANLKNDSTIFNEPKLTDKAFQIEGRPIVDITSGQFVLDPPKGIAYGRKQIVLGWRTCGSNASGWATTPDIQLQAYSVSSDLKTVTPLGAQFSIGPSTSDQRFSKFSIAAGGFEGASGTLPIDQLAVSYWFGKPDNGPTYVWLNTYRVTQNGMSLWQKSPSTGDFTGVSADARMRVPVIAYDGHGKSRYLGSPVHMTTTSPATEPDFILQEPPKHSYWDESDHQVVNFTRFDKNNVHLFNSTSASMSTQTTETTSRDTGGSISASANFTVKAGKDFGIIGGTAEAKFDVGAKASYDYNEHEEKFNSGYEARTTESTSQTDRDDFVKGVEQTFDIWRYRVYGTPTEKNSNGFYELVFPGPQIAFSAGGLSISWYQPIQENGNILSYPERLGAGDQFIPADIGPYKLNGKEEKTKPQVPAAKYVFGGTSGSTSLSWASGISNGSSFSYSHVIGESADVKVAYTVEAKTPYANTSGSVCGSIEFHNSNSWGENNSSTSTTTDKTAITLNRVAGSVAEGYPFYPVIYNTKGGAIKLTYSVPNPADQGGNPAGYQTFANLYGGLPDPALNLPERFLPQSVGSGQLETWVPNTGTTRKKMRGLFFRQSVIEPSAGTYLLWAFNPRPGDKVRIEPRIYNYSTAKTATGIDVEFQAIRYDSYTNSEMCDSPINAAAGKTTGLVCPRSARVTIGRTTVNRLNPLQFTCASGYDDPAVTGCAPSAFLNWDTTNFGPEFGTYDYRVYVVLNPNKPQGQEIYGLESNPINITNVENTTPKVITAPGSDLETGEYVTIGGVQGVDGANGTFVVTRISNSQFALNGSSSTRGDYTGGGTLSILDPGQNNEGYGTISITRVPSLTATEDSVPHDYLDGNSLQDPAKDGSVQAQGSVQTAVQDIPADLRFTAFSSIVHSDGARVLLFDGDPREGSPAIADQVIHPGAHGSDGTSIWLTWTPTTTGQHHLYAALVEGSQKDQPAAELDVNVIPLRPAISANGGGAKSGVK